MPGEPRRVFYYRNIGIRMGSYLPLLKCKVEIKTGNIGVRQGLGDLGLILSSYLGSVSILVGKKKYILYIYIYNSSCKSG